MTIIKKNQFDEARLAPIFNATSDDDGWNDDELPDATEEDDTEDWQSEADDDEDVSGVRMLYVQTIDSLTRQINEAGRKLLESLPDITAEALRLAIGRVDAKEAVVSAVSTVIAERNLTAPIRIHASAADAALLTAHQKDGGFENCEIIIDPLLENGEAVVESVLGRIHAGPSARAQEIGRALKRGRA